MRWSLSGITLRDVAEACGIVIRAHTHTEKLGERRMGSGTNILCYQRPRQERHAQGAGYALPRWSNSSIGETNVFCIFFTLCHTTERSPFNSAPSLSQAPSAWCKSSRRHTRVTAMRRPSHLSTASASNATHPPVPPRPHPSGRLTAALTTPVATCCVPLGVAPVPTSAGSVRVGWHAFASPRCSALHRYSASVCSPSPLALTQRHPGPDRRYQLL